MSYRPLIILKASIKSLLALLLFRRIRPSLFHVNKFKAMHMGYNNTTCPEYFLNGTKLDTVSDEKDLGVFISDDLKWKNTAVRQSK